ncbi:MAG TPA: phage major capsid protein [Holosporales bacterium]|nr:phage major capsid protein [Holosporales bacterium]
MEDKTLTNMEQSVKNLENTFAQFTQESERKMNQFYATKSAFSMSCAGDSFDTQNKSADFRSFLTKGMGHKMLSTQSNGGEYTVPNFVVEHIHSQLKIGSSLRSIASVTDVSSDSYELLIDKGGANVGWAGEMDERQETDLPELKKIQIHTHELYAKPRASQKVLDDSSINLEEWIGNKISESMSIMENTAFIKGDGDKKPKGILSYPLSDGESDDHLQVIKTGENGAIKNADSLLAVVDALRSDFLPGACWMMSRSALSMLRGLKDESRRYLLQPSLSEGMAYTLLGFPIVLNDALDQVRSGEVSTPILFGNFKQGYQIVDRRDVTLLRDPYSAKPFVEFYATKRVGGAVVDFSAIKVLQFSE